MNKLVNICNKINIEISDDQINCFEKYYELLIEKNKVMNLTAITDKEDVIVKHFIDSIALIPYLTDKGININNKLKIIDIGTGAGFPGLPLKIMMPDVKFTLLDSLNKRVSFLNEVIDELKLKDIEALHGRAEDYASDNKYREKYDICVSRAVANLSTLSEYCIPFVKEDGFFISYKAGESEEEINNSKNAIKILGGKINKVEEFVLPGTDVSRVFVFIRKLELTDKKYPRKAGVPAKKPL
ncbi:MAG: 16S rRNA (guanine(527)-N(7))-methyltransferase RsmG [Lachnospiraceae bacterium]|nr:16S rRNA (guanine(527)-N(7))-methyltransferase RsmG [Lachnospiraceae bacterium]